MKISTSAKGFTLIELVIVITVIIILTSISAIGVNIYLKDARDSERANKALMIANALEKYYEKNGEYPSCTAVSSSLASAVETLDDIDRDILKTPNADEPKPLSCGVWVWPSEENDLFLYEDPIISPTNLGLPREKFNIYYWNEADQQIHEVASERNQ